MKFDKFGDLEISPSDDVIFCPFKFPGAQLARELAAYERPYNLVYPGQGVLTGNCSTLYIWGHGNYKDVIVTDPKKRKNPLTGERLEPKVESLGARQLAAVLQSSGLPTGFSRDIVVWTCWGGVPGGLAQGLFLSLWNKGYKNAKLRVWGARYLTGPIVRDYPLIYKLPQWRVVGDDDSLPFGTGMELTSPRPPLEDAVGAKLEDLGCYPGK
jgi:hypothetical protein